MVDLPGYGYAQVARESRAHWEQTLGTYIRKRNELVGLVLIMDARRPFTDLDETLVAWFSETGKPIHALLTKADKLNRSERTDALRATRKRLAELSPFHTAQLFSALDKTGVDEPPTCACSRCSDCRRRSRSRPRTARRCCRSSGQKKPRRKGNDTGVITPYVKAPAQGGEAGDGVSHPEFMSSLSRKSSRCVATVDV